jgi:protoporphyrin/coproporphyrin ferrochelatase
MSERAAILLLAHGTPDALDEIPEYLSNVTGGRPMPDSVIAEIRHRYSLIGISPLTRLTLEQGQLLSEDLGVPVYVGMRNWTPYIRDIVAKMREAGVTKIVAICLAPQNSRTSVGLYRRVLDAAIAAGSTPMQVDFTEGWADHPLLAEAFAERLRRVLEPFQAEAGHPIPVLFTAHSVPTRTVEPPPPAEPGQAQLPPDPYAIEAKRTAALVAERTGLAPDQRHFAFQSQGMSGGPWIGPTVEDTLTALHRQGVNKIVIAPIGFLCDHVEILYDIDIAFRELAGKLQMELKRPESLNDSPLLTAALADLARKGLARLG